MVKTSSRERVHFSNPTTILILLQYHPNIYTLHETFTEKLGSAS